MTSFMVRTTMALELRVKLALSKYYGAPLEARFQSLAKRLAEGGGAIRSLAPPPATPAAAAAPPPPPRPAPPPVLPPIPGVPPEKNLKGLSFAVANATGLLALALQSASPPEVRSKR